MDKDLKKRMHEAEALYLKDVNEYETLRSRAIVLESTIAFTRRMYSELRVQYLESITDEDYKSPPKDKVNRGSK